MMARACDTDIAVVEPRRSGLVDRVEAVGCGVVLPDCVCAFVAVVGCWAIDAAVTETVDDLLRLAMEMSLRDERERVSWGEDEYLEARQS